MNLSPDVGNNPSNPHMPKKNQTLDVHKLCEMA